MRKSIVKFLSAFLALVLVLSVLPMAAFAADAEEHEHTDCSCTAARAAIKCTHPLMSAHYDSVLGEITDSGHCFVEVICYTCETCLFSYNEPTGAYQFYEHGFVLDDGRISAVCLTCGYPNPE